MMQQIPLPDLEDIWDWSPAQNKHAFADIRDPREKRFPFYYWFVRGGG